MEPAHKEGKRQSSGRAFILGVVATLIVLSAWNSIPESGGSWILQAIAFLAHIFMWFFMIAVVTKFCSSIWRWLTR
jgi:hypothetical protein